MSVSPNPTAHSFVTPPLAEAALGIQFAAMEGFGCHHFGLLFPEISGHYPVVEEAQRLDPIVETFPLRFIVGHRLMLQQRAPTPRLLFKNSDASELIQVQPDRFNFNWRRTENEASEYPRYAANSRKCLEEFARFGRFCELQGIGTPNPNLCEVVYVNEIWPNEEESVIDLFAKCFNGIEWHDESEFGRPESVTYNRTFRIEQDRGRVYAEATIGQKRDKGQLIFFKLTGRVICRDGDDVESSLSVAHEKVVSAFVELTAADIRNERWGQRQ